MFSDGILGIVCSGVQPFLAGVDGAVVQAVGAVAGGIILAKKKSGLDA